MMKKALYILIPLVLVAFVLLPKVKNNLNMIPEVPEAITEETQEIYDALPSMNGNRGKERNSTRKNCLSDDCLAVSELNYPVSELPEQVIASLNMAIDDEYKAYSTYASVIKEFGEIRPFIMIIRAEEQHISSLKAIYDKYGIDIPENPYEGVLTAPASVEVACSTGVQAEIDNAALYKEELLPTVQDYEDITMVFNNLMNASQTKHLPAFERCSN